MTQALILENIKNKIGAMLLYGFHGKYPEDQGVQQFVQEVNEYNIGSAILYGYNIENPTQLKTLTEFLKERCPDLRLSLDQEGGRVERLKEEQGFKHTKSAKEIASSYTTSEAYTKYLRMAEMLKFYNIDINFGPCVDLDTNPPCPVIGGYDRSYSELPEIVVEYAEEFIKAHNFYNILVTLKHFPGHGYATEDTHLGLTDTTEVAVPDVEFIPYKKLMNQKNVAIMTAHVVNKKLDPTGVPATLSQPILSDLLKDKLGFKGLIITDDLMMSAIKKYYNLYEVIINAINAGCDILMFSRNAASSINSVDYDNSWDVSPKNVFRIILDGIAKGEIDPSRIEESYNKIQAYKEMIPMGHVSAGQEEL